MEMVRNSKFGVVMGNASMLTKSVADEVALTNEEDGVAEFLQNRLLFL
jgi:Predicted hydrolases of the HAD superfamily